MRLVIAPSVGTPGIDLLRFGVGSALDHLGAERRVQVVESADQTFSRAAARTGCWRTSASAYRP